MSGVTGNFTGLRRLIENLETAIKGGLQERVAQELAVEARKLVADQFRAERDPYGTPWAPLKHRKGRILRDTNYMAGHVGTFPQSNGFRITFLAPYAKVHQTGGVVKPHQRAAREMRRSKRGLFAKGTRTKKGTVRAGSFTVLPRMQAGYTIPRRALLPTASLGGLGPIWTKAFSRTTARVVRQHFEKQKAAGGGA